MVATTTDNRANLKRLSCDLLKNIYLCGSNNNKVKLIKVLEYVVICLKISIFVVATTTKAEDSLFNTLL